MYPLTSRFAAENPPGTEDKMPTVSVKFFLPPAAASLHAGIATGPGEWRNHDLRLSRWNPKIRSKRRNRQQRSCGASKQCSFHCDPLRSLTCVSSHRQPDVSEQRVVGRGADASAVEPIVPGILQPDARVEPRPAWREAADEWDIGDFGDPAVGIRT